MELNSIVINRWHLITGREGESTQLYRWRGLSDYGVVMVSTGTQAPTNRYGPVTDKHGTHQNPLMKEDLYFTLNIDSTHNVISVVFELYQNECNTQVN